MVIIILYIGLVLVVNTVIFWSFTEIARDKQFSEGMGIGTALCHCAIVSLIGVGVRLAQVSAPLHLVYLFKPFHDMGLNTASKFICLFLMGGAEFLILKVMAKSLAKALNAF